MAAGLNKAYSLATSLSEQVQAYGRDLQSKGYSEEDIWKMIDERYKQEDGEMYHKTKKVIDLKKKYNIAQKNGDLEIVDKVFLISGFASILGVLL